MSDACNEKLKFYSTLKIINQVELQHLIFFANYRVLLRRVMDF